MEYLKAGTHNDGVAVDNENISLLMYADDMVIMSNTPEGLQRQLDVFYDYCNIWKLNVNLSKTKVIICNKRVLNDTEVWFYGDQRIEECDMYNYLGITFTKYGINNNSLNVLANQAKKSLGELNMNVSKIGTFPPHVGLRLFHTSITPVLHYGCEVWGYIPGTCLQVVLDNYCKSILGVKRTTPNCAVRGELGQFPLSIDRKIKIIKYWYKIISGPHTRYRYILYKYLKSNYNSVLPVKYKNWAKEVRSILISVGHENIWHTEVLDCSLDVFISNIKQTLIDLYIVQWREELFVKDKLSTFRLFKTVFAFESYLYNVTIPRFRIALSRLRLSSHSLEIERGRYPPLTPRHRRYCRQCYVQDIEDEYHFILVCNKFNNIRRKYIPVYFRERPNMHKFVQLMNTCVNDVLLCNNVSKFVFFCLKDH